MRATWLADILTDAGLTIKPFHGWETRGFNTLAAQGVMWHHTVTKPSTSDLLIDQMLATTGSSTTNPPLCNYSTNRNGTISIIAAGTANHGGTGSWKGLSGNRSFLGDEMKNLGTPAEPWPEVQLDSARRAAAAILSHLQSPSGMLCAHREYATPPGRKTDPHTLNMTDERSKVALLLHNQPGDEMTQALRLLVAEAGNKGWLKTEAEVNYWLVKCDTPSDPEWRANFEPAWSQWKADEGKAIGTVSPAGLTEAQVEIIVNQNIAGTKLTPP